MCGNQLSDDAKVCPSCGQPVDAVEEPKQETRQEKSDFSAKLDKLMDAPDSTEQYETKDIEENKLLSVLSYIGILFIVPYFMRPNSKYARFHANQGLVLFIASTLFQIGLGVGSFIPVIDFVFDILLTVASVAFFALAILGIINTCNGRVKELPIIGKYRILK